MKNILYALILLISILFGCSKKNSEPENLGIVIKTKLLKVTPQKLKISDTITIEGENLDRIWLKFNSQSGIWILSRQNNKIVAIIPTLYNENVMVYAMYGAEPGVAIDSIPFSLIGFVPLYYPLEGDIGNVKALNEKTFFATISSRLYKTVDGGYHWSTIRNFNSWISSIFFLDDNLGWVGLYEQGISNLYFTNDGGNSFKLIFNSGQSYDGRCITEMFFLSGTQGYLLSGKGEIYATSDNSKFDLLYAYPGSNRESGTIEFNHLSVNNNIILATGISRKNVLINGKDNVFKYLTFDEELKKVQLINDHEAYLIRGDRLYFSNDIGNTWTKVSDMKLHNFYFSAKNIGFGISSDNNYTHHNILQTNNGGISWQIGRTLFASEYTMDLAFLGNVGLISGYRSQMWKYMKE
jgi:hypothetical protein